MNIAATNTHSLLIIINKTQKKNINTFIMKKVTTLSILSNMFCSTWGYTLMSSLAVVFIALTSQRQEATASKAQRGQTQLCSVLKVVDGDSINVRCFGEKHRLRLMHIDAPEMKQKPWGDRARRVLKSLIKDDEIFVEFHKQDIYHRDLAVVYANKDAKALNLQLVGQGVARVYRRYKPPSQYVSAMKKAKKQRVGIWQKAGLHQDPMRFRRLMY